ncbi:MAG: dihydrodipicolinate synthase family protein [Ignavibacteriales bacterium]|nr:MAG: dihydrodipicolinate synthase family protein [Ignavibacteriales bacterium]
MIKGIYPPLATPFINGEVAYDKLQFNISKYNSTGLSGYVVFGSNGESVFLSDEEKIKIVSTVKASASNDKKIIAGTGSESIRETIRLTNAAADEGADYALVLTPSYYKSSMDHQAMIDYFNSVADSIKIPLIIYNVPKFTGICIEPRTVSQLALHSNIAGLKNSYEDIAHTAEIIKNTPEDFTTLIGTASVLYPGLALGCKGGILALANIAVDECISIYKNYINGNYNEAKNIQLRILELNKAVTARFGVAGLKAALDMLGYFGGEPMKPLRRLNEVQFKELKEILIRAELLL